MTTWLLCAMWASAPPSPPTKPAPVLFTRVVAPAGVQVSFRPADPAARFHPVPADVGLRPGYVYRFKLANIPGEPGITLYPSVEVRAGLFMPINLNPRDFRPRSCSVRPICGGRSTAVSS